MRLLLALAASLALLVGGAAPSQAATATSITGWVNTPLSAPVGYALSNTVTVSAGGVATTRTVSLQRRLSGTTAWGTLSSATTSTTGSYTAQYAVHALGSYEYRLYVAATATEAAASTSPRTVTGIAGIATSLTGWPTTTARAAVNFLYTSPITVRTGTTTTTRTVRIERKPSTSSTWVGVSTYTTTSAGTVTLRYAAPSAGTFHVRAVVLATPTQAQLITATRTITGYTVATDANSIARAYILDAMNEQRLLAGVAMLTRTSALDTVAQNWSQKMLSAGVLSHNPNLKSQIPSGWRTCGENVASSGREPVGPVMFGLWWNSSPHRANMLNGKYTAVGIGVACNGDVCYATQDFWG